MNQFLKKIFFLSLPVLGFILLTFYQADGRTDPFYLRFTTPKQHSCILGTSRAAQGIIPGVIDSSIRHRGMFNYSMTMANSPYGEVYFEAIKKKLISASLDERFDRRRDGLFILEVNPWSISSTAQDPNDASSFREADLFLSKLHLFNVNPNIEYLTRFSSKANINLWNQQSNQMLLHSDGWLEINVAMDSISVYKRTQNKLNTYKTLQPQYNLSQVRLAYLQKTIDYLKDHGQVILVRVPIHPEMYKIENELMPDFDGRMNALSKSEGISYLKFGAEGDNYQFTDGNHLWKESARKFSEDLGARIASERLQKTN